MLRAKLKNKISALRSRMKQKINKDEQQNQKLATYQANFRMFTKSLLDLFVTSLKDFYPRFMLSLGNASVHLYSSVTESEGNSIQKHILINEMEKFLWIQTKD